MTNNAPEITPNTIQPADFEALFPQALDFFDSLCLHLERYDIKVPSQMDLKLAPGLFPYYNFEDGLIYVAIPVKSTGTGKLQKIYMRSLLLCEDDYELLTLFQVFIPFMIAHELGHGLRHQRGLFDPAEAWKEEQIANQLAAAVIQRHLTLEQKTECRRLIFRALQNLGAKLEEQTGPGSSHHSLLYALHTEGAITDQVLDNLQVMEKIFAAQAEDILLFNQGTANLLTSRLTEREEIVAAYNDNSADDITKNMYYLLGWLYYNLTSRQDIYIDEFVRLHLGLQARLLPTVSIENEPTTEAIKASHHAALLIKPISEIGYRYYYKRYRALLLDKIRRKSSDSSTQFDAETIDFFEGWEDNGADILNYLGQFVEVEIRSLLPNNIDSSSNGANDPILQLPTETDGRIWRRIMENNIDYAASETLLRLELLEQISIFKSLPAEILLTLAQNFYQIKLDTGESLIRQGENDRNVYVLLEGTLDVFVINSTSEQQHLHTIGKGVIFGEMAFFTGQPRSASIIAAAPSTCYILKASDLRYLMYKYPIISIEMGSALAQKLHDTTTLVQT